MHLRSGDVLVLTPEQEWLLVANGQLIHDHGRIRPASDCDEQRLRMHVEGTAAGLVCSFCASPKPSWRYPARKVDLFPDVFVLPGQELGLPPTEWLACDECARLIERTDRAALTRRSTRCSFRIPATARDPDIVDAVHGVIRYIQDEFWSARLGAPERVPSFQTQV